MLFRKFICYLFGHNFIKSRCIGYVIVDSVFCQRCGHSVEMDDVGCNIDKVYPPLFNDFNWFIFGSKNERRR